MPSSAIWPREASTRSMRGGQRVLILPGIMGSTLGWPRTGWLDDVLWFDPVDIAAGRLTDLRLNGGGSDIKALGVILYAYLKLKLNLKIGGYDADFHPFDWRRNLSDLGRELADRIRAEGRPVSLVAHSMGGLVARAALKTKLDPVVKVIQLGTPNYGSYCPVQVLRATYDTVKKIAAIDFKHTITQLCNEVFNTFIGLYQMLPAPGKSALDLFDAAKWPQSDPRPLAPLLKLARDTQSLMVTGDNRFYLIAGVNQNTVTGVSVDDGEFVFSMSQDGDGTVPLDFAKLDGIPANQIYYVEAGHGDLPNNAQVEQAVRELLASGRTGVLPNERPASSRQFPRCVNPKFAGRTSSRSAVESYRVRVTSARPCAQWQLRRRPVRFPGCLQPQRAQRLEHRKARLPCRPSRGSLSGAAGRPASNCVSRTAASPM